MKSLFALLLLCTVTNLQAQTPPSADAVLQEAQQQAGRENKKVLVIFHASWCGWCKQMDASLNHPSIKKYFDEAFVIRHLTVLESAGKKESENPGGEDMLNQYGGKEQGIPFWLVFDSKGKLLADSKLRPRGAGLDAAGNNVGCPATEDEVQHFIDILRRTTAIHENGLQAIHTVFRKNDQ